MIRTCKIKRPSTSSTNALPTQTTLSSEIRSSLTELHKTINTLPSEQSSTMPHTITPLTADKRKQGQKCNFTTIYIYTHTHTDKHTRAHTHTHPSFPYAPWPTTGAVPKELRGDPLSPSDQRKKSPYLYPAARQLAGKDARTVTDKIAEIKAKAQRALPHKIIPITMAA